MLGTGGGFFVFLQGGFCEGAEPGGPRRSRDRLLYNATVVKLRTGKFVPQVAVRPPFVFVFFLFSPIFEADSQVELLTAFTRLEEFNGSCPIISIQMIGFVWVRCTVGGAVV